MLGTVGRKEDPFLQATILGGMTHTQSNSEKYFLETSGENSGPVTRHLHYGMPVMVPAQSNVNVVEKRSD